MIPLFDYHNINEDHKAAAEECAKLIENIVPPIAAQIRERFKLVEPPKLSLDDSEFYTKAKEFGIMPATQGYMVGPDGVHIPMVAICAEITKLDDFIKSLNADK